MSGENDVCKNGQKEWFPGGNSQCLVKAPTYSCQELNAKSTASTASSSTNHIVTMFTFTPLLGALSASPASQSLLEFDGGIKVLVDVGWDDSFDVEKLKEIEKYVDSSRSARNVGEPRCAHHSNFVSMNCTD